MIKATYCSGAGAGPGHKAFSSLSSNHRRPIFSEKVKCFPRIASRVTRLTMAAKATAFHGFYTDNDGRPRSRSMPVVASTHGGSFCMSGTEYPPSSVSLTSILAVDENDYMIIGSDSRITSRKIDGEWEVISNDRVKIFSLYTDVFIANSGNVWFTDAVTEELLRECPLISPTPKDMDGVLKFICCTINKVAKKLDVERIHQGSFVVAGKWISNRGVCDRGVFTIQPTRNHYYYYTRHSHVAMVGSGSYAMWKFVRKHPFDNLDGSSCVRNVFSAIEAATKDDIRTGGPIRVILMREGDHDEACDDENGCSLHTWYQEEDEPYFGPLSEPYLGPLSEPYLGSSLDTVSSSLSPYNNLKW